MYTLVYMYNVPGGYFVGCKGFGAFGTVHEDAFVALVPLDAV